MRTIPGQAYVLTEQEYNSITKTDDGLYIIPIKKKERIYKPVDDDLDKIVAMIDNGASRAKICDEFNCTMYVLRMFLKKHDVAKNNSHVFKARARNAVKPI